MVKTMKMIYFQLHDNIQYDKRLTACIGYFDGLHLGHQQLISRVLEIAKQTNSEPALITFDPDPWQVLHAQEQIAHLTPLAHRIELAKQYGITTCIILKFDEALANVSYQDFHTQVLEKLHIQTLVCGFDFRYGKQGEGSIETLQMQNIFHISIVNEVSKQHVKISSSMIENLIKQGNIEEANALMNRAYELRGTIIKGAQQGRKHGFPTANLGLSNAYVLPANGVYIAEVYVKKKWYPAMINIGHNPTYNFQRHRSIEAHILDFDEMIYEEQTIFRFHRFIRKEQKFSSLQALLSQLNKDLETTRTYFLERGALVYASKSI